MNKKIIILNGAARKNGNTIKLIEAFANGAEKAGNQVKIFYLDGMEIHSCKGCLQAGGESKSPCTQKDDIVAAILRGIGDSKATLYFLLVASVVNVLLDILMTAVSRDMWL